MKERAQVRVILQVADLSTTIEILKKAGLHFRNQMEVAPGRKQIQIEDPAGNPIELVTWLCSAFDIIREPHPIVGNLQIGKLHVGRGSISEGASLPCHQSATTRPLLRGETFPLFSVEAVFHPLDAS